MCVCVNYIHKIIIAYIIDFQDDDHPSEIYYTHENTAESSAQEYFTFSAALITMVLLYQIDVHIMYTLKNLAVLVFIASTTEASIHQF